MIYSSINEQLAATKKIWFTADTHFGSERTLALSKRPFSSVTEMDTVIKDNWNSVVGSDDMVYHLGDFGSYNMSKNLNGHIILLCGNYERDDITNNIISMNALENNFNFESVVDPSETLMQINTDIKEIQFLYACHEPSYCHKNSFNLFGHIHKLCMIKRFGLNVGTDCHSFYPIDTDTVLFYKTAIEKYYDNEVFSEFIK